MSRAGRRLVLDAAKAARSPSTNEPSRLVALRCVCAAAFAAFLADFTAIFAAALACFASVANAAGLEMASSDRLLRSSVTPAFFKPLINCP